MKMFGSPWKTWFAIALSGLVLGSYVAWRAFTPPLREPPAASSQDSPAPSQLSPLEWKDSNLSIDQLRERIKAPGKNFRTWWYLGHKLLNGKEYEEAVQVFETMAKAWPESAQVHLDLAVAYNFVNRYDEAATQLSQVLKLEPNHPGADGIRHVLEGYRRTQATRSPASLEE